MDWIAEPDWTHHCPIAGQLRSRCETSQFGHEASLLEACRDAGLWIARVNPRQAHATCEPAKTDAMDARLLALMTQLFDDRLRTRATARGSARCATGCVGGHTRS